MHRKVIKSFAKINLFVNVVSKKKKFHRIQSLFSFIDLHDRIEISTINRKKHFIKFDGKFSKGIGKKNSISCPWPLRGCCREFNQRQAGN